MTEAPARPDAHRPSRWVPRPAAWRPDVVLAVVAPALFLAVAGYHRRWMSDDGFINMRVVQNLLAGNGPVLNAGERIEVATSPLWVYLVAAAKQVWRVDLEYVFIALGIVSTAAGMVAASCGAVLVGRTSRRHFWLPAGAVVYAALTPAWDFTTSGLDGSLAVAWIGGAVLLVAMVEYRGDRRSAFGAAFVLGLAPLVRPDLTLMAAVMFAALAALEWRRGWRRLAALVGVGAAVPFAYQVFRMGYYGLIVPNTAVAKEATWWRSDQGWKYFDDFVSNFGVRRPLAAVAVLAVLVGLVPAMQREWRRVLPLAAPMVAGVLHGAYVVAVGGDFMSARLLLPSLFAVVAPVAVVAVPVPARRWQPAVASMLVPILFIGWWAYVCNATPYKVPYGDEVGPDGIADERAFYARFTEDENPLEMADYEGTQLWEARESSYIMIRERQYVVCTYARTGCLQPAPPLHTRWRDDADVVVVLGNIGILSAASPLRAHVADQVGLGDPLAARMKLHKRARPGHEKALSMEWIVARFGAPDAFIPPPLDEDVVAQAREVLDCPQWREIEVAVTAPLTLGRFLDNLFGAFGRDDIRIDMTDPPTDCRFDHAP